MEAVTQVVKVKIHNFCGIKSGVAMRLEMFVRPLPAPYPGASVGGHG